MSRENALMRHGDINILGILRAAPQIAPKDVWLRRGAQNDKREGCHAGKKRNA